MKEKCMANFSGWLFIVAGLALLAVFGQLTWLLYLVPIAVIIAVVQGWLCQHHANRQATNGVA